MQAPEDTILARREAVCTSFLWLQGRELQSRKMKKGKAAVLRSNLCWVPREDKAPAFGKKHE